jgi:CAAX protease family protein
MARRQGRATALSRVRAGPRSRPERQESSLRAPSEVGPQRGGGRREGHPAACRDQSPGGPGPSRLSSWDSRRNDVGMAARAPGRPLGRGEADGAGTAVRSFLRERPVLAFVALALALSWSAWLPLLASAQGWVPWHVSPYLHQIGSLGPALSALIVVGAVSGRPGLTTLLRRAVAWRGRSRAFAFAVGTPVALLAVAIPVALWIDGSHLTVRWSQLGHSVELSSLPVLLYWAVSLLCYGFGEELGWRGFLQPHLEGRWPVATAASVLSLVWAAWHVPLFGITPSYRAMPVIGFVGFYVSIWVASWIFAWLRRYGRGSLLVVAVFHAWFDIVSTSPVGITALPMAMGIGITLVGLLILRVLLRAEKMKPTVPSSAV